jgi:filamentous hemagglutinin family protein
MLLKKTKKQILSLSLVALQAIFPGGMAYALPHGGIVTSGKGTVSVVGNTLTVNQASNFLMTKWSSFNIWTGQTVRFVQPSRSSIAINTILGNTATNIFGRLLANGQVWLVNPNGVVFGPGAEVNTRGLLVSALSLNGTSSQPTFSGTGTVSNAGTLTGDYYLALIGSSVTNKGTLNSSNADMLAGTNVSLTFANNDILSYAINSNAIPALAANSGKIVANGGSVWVAAGAKDSIARSVVNNTGVIDAQTLASGKNGQIWLLAGQANGTVNVGGTLNASAPNGGNGGNIDTSAGRVNILKGLFVSTLANNGRTGTWTIDPNSFYIGENTGAAKSTYGNVTGHEDISGTQLASDLGLSNIVIDSTMGNKGSLGNIYVDNAVLWSSGNTLTLNAINNVLVNANILNSGTGNITLRADDISIGGMTSTSTTSGVPSGIGSVIVGSGDSVGTTGTLSIYTNPSNYTTALAYTNAKGGTLQAFDLLSTHTDLSYIDSSQSSQVLSNNYALNQNVTLPTGGTTGNWTPFGSSSVPYSGIFNGQGHSISRLDINLPTSNYVGFFGYATGTIENFGLVSPTINGSEYVAPLIGEQNGGTITNAYVSGGSVTGTNSFVGGLVGKISSGTLTQSWATPSLYANQSISGAAGYFGGLAGGVSSGTISKSWFGGNFSNIGVGSPTIGGVTGYNSSGTYSSDYYNSSLVTSMLTITGVTPLTTAQFAVASNFGFSSSFNTFSSTGGFLNSALTDPWFMGTVSGGGTSYTAPVLVEDMNSDAITASTRTRFYSGNASDTFVQRMDSSAVPATGVSASSSSANVGTGVASVSVSGLVAPGRQSGTAYFLLSGVQTIIPEPLEISTSVTKTYDGTSSVSLSSGNTSINGLVSGQTASLSGTMSESLSSSNVGTNLGGGISLTNSNLSGNVAFLGALSSGDYTLPTVFSGGTITPRKLTFNTTATKNYDGNESLTLSPEDTALGDFASGQSGFLKTSLNGTLFSPIGKNIGGTWSGTLSVSGNTTFLAALASGDYKWNNRFFGGTVIGGNITPKADSVAASSDQVECLGTYCTQKPPQKPGKKDRYHDVPLPLSFIEIIHMKNGGTKLPEDILETSPYTILGTWPESHEK